MSRIFEALRKSEEQLRDQSFVSPETLLKAMDKAHAPLDQIPIERARIRPESRVVVYSDPRGLATERFRLLRTRLMRWQLAKKLKTLLITSPLPQDGKSVVAVNLATVMAGCEGRTVLLLEGDLRQASLLPQLGLNRWPGLRECLESNSDPISAVRRIEPLGFYVLPAGRPTATPVELLQSQRFSDLVRSLASCFDWIFIDSPPVSLLADTPVLRTQADATLLVVRAGVTPREGVEEALRLLGPEHVMGVVLNGADGLEREYYRYRQYGSSSDRGSEKKHNPEGRKAAPQ